MNTIPCATAITLTAEERTVLEALSVRPRARYGCEPVPGSVCWRLVERRRVRSGVLGCTTGTAAKWRVRYAHDRFAGLDETGNRGAAAKYGPVEQQRILALLDQPLPTGYSNWTASLLPRALGDVHEQYIWLFSRA
jgi:hypothetical protein